MKYFENLTDENTIKARYKELAKAHHPDLGGCVEIMKVINAQYELVITGAYQTAGKSITEIDELLKDDLLLREKLNLILALEGLEIEICGKWLWVTGDTKTHKEKLKELKFFWSKLKTAWYWRDKDQRSFNRIPCSLDDIRYKYGSQNVKCESRKSIAA